MSYFDTTVFNRIAQQQKETNDLLRELIKTLQEQKSKCRYPTQNFEPPVPAQTYIPPVFCKPVPQPQRQWPNQNPYTLTCCAEQATQPQRPNVLDATLGASDAQVGCFGHTPYRPKHPN